MQRSIFTSFSSKQAVEQCSHSVRQEVPPNRVRIGAVAWFFRILRNAVVDHYWQKAGERQRANRLLLEMRAAGETYSKPPKEWDAAVCACFRELLPALKPRFAELIRRVDLNGESTATVSCELKSTACTMGVLLNRSRQALRRRLETFWGHAAVKAVWMFCQRSDSSPEAARTGM